MYPFYPTPSLWPYYTFRLLPLVLLVGILYWVARRSKPGGESRDVFLLLITAATSLLFNAENSWHPVFLTAAARINLLLLALCFGGSLLLDFQVARASRNFLRSIWMFTALLFWGLAVGMWPPMQYSRSAAARSQCKNNLKQIGLALHNYHDVYAMFPQRAVDAEHLSWRVAILPYLDYMPLYETYVTTAAWDSEENQPVATKVIASYLCPSAPGNSQHSKYPFTAYAIPYGTDTVWQGSAAPTLKDITDGSSNTVAVVEACGQQIPWAAPRDCSLEQIPVGFNLDGNQPGRSEGLFSSYHYGGAFVLLCDGSARFLIAETDPTVIKALLTATGGEPVDEF